MNSENQTAEKISPEFYMHLIFFLLALLVIVMSFVMTVSGTRFVYLPGAILPMPESCTTKYLLGVDCPGCGMTRAFISISHGEFAKAWKFNPASFIAYVFVAVQIPWQIIQMRRLWKRQRSIESVWIYYLPVGMAICMILQWLIRLAS